MFLYDTFFSNCDKTVAQILLNADDIEQEEKKENLTNTFNALLEMGIIPVVNENDSVSYTEIESAGRLFGDNDMLSAAVAVLCKASKLVIFSDIDGLYDNDPRRFPSRYRRDENQIAGGTPVDRTGNRYHYHEWQPSRRADIANGLNVGTLFAGKRHT